MISSASWVTSEMKILMATECGIHKTIVWMMVVVCVMARVHKY